MRMSPGFETALNHLTVLEFHEPVTMAAAGSPDFQIERQDYKGLSTRLIDSITKSPHCQMPSAILPLWQKRDIGRKRSH